MKAIEREVTTKVIEGYLAFDKTYFCEKEDCEKYEKSALGVLKGRIQEMAIRSTTEYGLFEMGSDDCDVFVVVPKSEEDIDKLNQLAILINGDEQRKVADDVIGKMVFVYTGYHNDCCWFDTLDKLVSRITDGKYEVVEKVEE